jgi:hypothetical protein
MTHPLPLLVGLVAVAALLGMGSVLNSACKSSPHAWCAPPPKVHLSATRTQDRDNNSLGRTASRDRALSQR